MRSIWAASLVIARRDFWATVKARSFIFFMITPLLVVGFAILTAVVQSSNRDEGPKVAIVTDAETRDALIEARARLVAGTDEREFPRLERVDPAQVVWSEARALIGDDESDLSAVFSGTLDRPVLSGPERIDNAFVGKRMTLIIEEAQRNRVLAGAAPGSQPAAVERDVTAGAAGNLREVRTGVARFGQFIVFFMTLLLATMLLSNLIEEKSNKVIEVLAASVPLDAIFFGKLLAMLGVSLIGIALWGGMAALAAAFSVQLMPAGFELPDISPAIGWPIYVLLLAVYFTTNYMILGSLFLGIGGQATSVREMQNLNMPVTFLQMGFFVLALTVVGGNLGLWQWAAFIIPFSSPMAMIAEAGQSATLWPHLLAIPWQAFWVFLLIRISAAMFRKTVLKSGGEIRIMPRFGRKTQS